MEFVAGPGLLTVFVVVFVSALVIHLRLRAQRQRAWRMWVVARDWVLHDTWQQMALTFRHGPFGRGSNRRCVLGYEGTFDGLSAAGFGYEYSTGSGKNRTRHRFHISLVRVPGAGFPVLTLSPESWAHRVFTEDIHFEDAEFNRRWWVNSPSPRFAHDVVHPRLMLWLKETSLPGLSTLWFEGDAILLATPRTLRPEEVDARLHLLSRVADSLPRFVLNDVGCTDRLQITSEGPGISVEEQQRRIQRYRAQR